MHIFLKQSCGHAVISDAKAAHGSKKSGAMLHALPRMGGMSYTLLVAFK